MARRNVPINYTSRDFESIRTDLVNYAKRYYPDTFKDFGEASFGSLMFYTFAYVGDIMSFYLDSLLCTRSYQQMPRASGPIQDTCPF